jgi:hypothetical protein
LVKNLVKIFQKSSQKIGPKKVVFEGEVANGQKSKKFAFNGAPIQKKGPKTLLNT